MSLALIGYRGTGKSTVGRLLAARLGWEAVDADEAIERRAGRSIAEIFAQEGEAGFRRLEADVIGQLARRERIVLAAGGGAVLDQASRQALRSMKAVVWLEARPETLWRRISADAATAGRRPDLTVAGGLAEIEALLAAREDLYRTTATLRVDTEGIRPAEVVERIWAHLPDGLADDEPPA